MFLNINIPRYFILAVGKIPPSIRMILRTWRALLCFYTRLEFGCKTNSTPVVDGRLVFRTWTVTVTTQ